MAEVGGAAVASSGEHQVKPGQQRQPLAVTGESSGSYTPVLSARETNEKKEA